MKIVIHQICAFGDIISGCLCHTPYHSRKLSHDHTRVQQTTRLKTRKLVCAHRILKELNLSHDQHFNTSGANFNFSICLVRIFSTQAIWFTFLRMCAAISPLQCAVKLPGIFFNSHLRLRRSHAMPWAGRKFLVGQRRTSLKAAFVCGGCATLDWTKRGMLAQSRQTAFGGASAVRLYLADFCARLAGCSVIFYALHHPRVERHQKAGRRCTRAYINCEFICTRCINCKLKVGLTGHSTSNFLNF
jgi:hypothetical protein